MNTNIFGIEQEGKIDCNDFSDIKAVQIDAVKIEPREADIFTECGSYYNSFISKTDSVSHNHATDSYPEQTEEKLDVKNQNPEDFDHFKFSDNSSSKFDAIQIKNEDNIDVIHEEIKSEIDEAISMSRLKLFKVQDEDEVTNEEDSSAVSWRLPVENDEMKIEVYSNPLEIPERIHTEEKSFHCKICSMAFSTLGNLRTHGWIHSGEKPVHCNICSTSFITLDELKVHESIHKGVKRFNCKLCPKSFSRMSDLKIHDRGHTGEKPYHCKICSETFTYSRKLRIHGRVHTGEKPFQCKICTKTFTTSSSLRTHGMIHSGEKPFRCKTCSKCFSRMNYVKIHERIHTGEKPFHCKFCSKSFSRGSKLIVHERSHTGEKLCHCNICFKTFTNSSDLKVHGRIHTRKAIQLQSVFKIFQSNE